ncbi:MAG: hypothetical protein ACTHMZ_05395 [Actinomycetes bacterium]
MRRSARPSVLGLALALSAALLTSCGQGGAVAGAADDGGPSRTTPLASPSSSAAGDAEADASDAADPDASDPDASDPDASDPDVDPDAVVGCPDADVSLDRPEALAADFPLPTGLRITDVESRSEGRLVIQGVTQQDFTAVLHELQQALPKAGYQLSEGEVEPHDAESNFASSTTKGRWAIREVEGCGTLVSLVTADA